MKSKLNKIKELLGMEIKLEQAMLIDGVTTVEAEEFAPDFSIGIVTEDTIVPMPVGEYETEDGKVIVVAVEGIIESVSDKPAEEPQSEVQVEAEVESEPQPKQIKEIREINFKKQKMARKFKLSEQAIEEAIEEIVEVAPEILEKLTEVINADTPDEVSVEDSKEIAEDVIDAIIEILDEQPDAFRKKSKMSAQTAQAIVHNPEPKEVEQFKLSKKGNTRMNSVLNKIYK
jgi:hypothetical protein